MLVLTLRSKEKILIDTPEGVAQIQFCPRPRCFRVVACPGQSLRTEPVAQAGLALRPGAKEWTVLESAAGRVRVRRLAAKHAAPRTAVPSGPAGASSGTIRQEVYARVRGSQARGVQNTPGSRRRVRRR